MRFDTIFTVKNEDLDRLDSTAATLFFRKLLWTEARRIGIEISKINVSSRFNVPDGGVDATVDDAQFSTDSGIILPGKTSYQIKSGEFKPWWKSQIKKALFGDRTPPNKHNLGESIRACLDVDGTYVLICTGIDLVDTQHRSAHNHIKEYLKLCGYIQPKVEVWSQNQLSGFLELFPSLALWVNRRDGGIFQTHDSWARDADMQSRFVSGNSQEVMISNIQNQLRRNDDTVHVRVLGEPGIGKTKVVLETTKVEDLSTLVIYCTAPQFRDSVLMNELLRDDNQFYAVLVIDECDPDSRSYIWNKLRHRDSKIKLITIYNDYEEKSGGIYYYDTPTLDNERISTIIQGYDIPKYQADQWADLCSGSPRIAHVIGENLPNHREDVLKPPSTVNIWKRYVVGNSDPNSSEVRERKRVLRYIALFKRFGYGRLVGDEAKTIAQKAKIEWERFQEIVHDLKNRRILQGETTLYITPKALHVKLWAEWWENYGEAFDLGSFTQDLTPKLVEWFYEMFAYARESEVASSMVKDLLSPNGPFHDGENLKTRLGSRFFFALAEAQPESALNCLMRTIGTWDRQTLLEFTEGRRNIIWSLQKIARRRDCFADAARLLLALGEAENEGFSNNASGVFAELFSPGPGRVAPTKAFPTERFPVLKEAFESCSRERRVLALRACDAALQSGHFSRTGSAGYQGLPPQPELWIPETYGELWDAYERVWRLLSEKLARLPDDERKDGAEVLIGRASGIGRIPDLADMVIDTVTTIANNMYVSEKQVIATVNEILHYHGENLPVETRERWGHLLDDLVGSDFHSMMKRFVGMELLEDLQLDDDRDYVDHAQPEIEAVAQQVVDTPSLLQSELDWLVTPEAQNGYTFGHELGKRDNDFSLLSTLLKAQRSAGEDASTAFLGGYFRACFELDRVFWEAQLDALIDDTKLNLLIPELTHRSGFTDRAGLRILHLAKSGIIGHKHFGIFSYAMLIDTLSEEVFAEWIVFLLQVSNRYAVSIALKLYSHFYVFPKPKPTLPLELTSRLLTQSCLFEESDSYEFDRMTYNYWARIGKAFVHFFPENSLELADKIHECFRTNSSIFRRFDEEIMSVLTEILKQHPDAVWERVSEHLENQSSFSTTVLEGWLRGRYSSVFMRAEEKEGALNLIRPEKIWEWIDADIENRAWYSAARLIPNILSPNEWVDSLARKLLVRYGGRDDVGRNLIGNYLTETFSGPSSLHYESKKHKLLRIKKGEISDGEDNQRVIRWIDKFVESLEEEIGRARIEEERRDF